MSYYFVYLEFSQNIGVAKILLGKGSAKETAFLDITPIHLEV